MKSSTKLVDPTTTEVDFIRSELATGLTLSKIAKDSAWHAKSDRNRANARKAYDAVIRFLPRVTLTDEEALELKAKLEHLKGELTKLGEEV